MHWKFVWLYSNLAAIFNKPQWTCTASKLWSCSRSNSWLLFHRRAIKIPHFPAWTERSWLLVTISTAWCAIIGLLWFEYYIILHKCPACSVWYILGLQNAVVFMGYWQETAILWADIAESLVVVEQALCTRVNLILFTESTNFVSTVARTCARHQLMGERGRQSTVLHQAHSQCHRYEWCGASFCAVRGVLKIFNFTFTCAHYWYGMMHERRWCNVPSKRPRT